MNRPQDVDVDAVLRLGEDFGERIAYIEEDHWFDVPFALALIERLSILLKHPPKIRPKCMLVIAESGMGKSAIINRFCALNPVQRNKKTGLSSCPVARIEMPEPATPQSLLEAFVGALNLPRPDVPFRLLQRYIERQYQDMGVMLSVVDEAQRINLAARDSARHCTELLKWLSNVTRRPVVAFGTAEVVPHFQRDPQLRNRFKPIELPKWTLDETFVALVKTQLMQLPLREPWDPGLLKRDGLQIILDRSGGTTDGILSLLKDAAIDALRDGREAITLSDVKSVQ